MINFNIAVVVLHFTANLPLRVQKQVQQDHAAPNPASSRPSAVSLSSRWQVGTDHVATEGMSHGCRATRRGASGESDRCNKRRRQQVINAMTGVKAAQISADNLVIRFGESVDAFPLPKGFSANAKLQAHSTADDPVGVGSDDPFNAPE